VAARLVSCKTSVHVKSSRIDADACPSPYTHRTTGLRHFNILAFDHRDNTTALLLLRNPIKIHTRSMCDCGKNRKPHTLTFVFVLREHIIPKVPILHHSTRSHDRGSKKTYKYCSTTKHFQSHDRSAAGVFSENATSESDSKMRQECLWQITKAFHGPSSSPKGRRRMRTTRIV